MFRPSQVTLKKLFRPGRDTSKKFPSRPRYLQKLPYTIPLRGTEIFHSNSQLSLRRTILPHESWLIIFHVQLSRWVSLLRVTWAYGSTSLLTRKLGGWLKLLWLPWTRLAWTSKHNQDQLTYPSWWFTCHFVQCIFPKIYCKTSW